MFGWGDTLNTTAQTGGARGKNRTQKPGKLVEQVGGGVPQVATLMTRRMTFLFMPVGAQNA